MPTWWPVKSCTELTFPDNSCWIVLPFFPITCCCWLAASFFAAAAFVAASFAAFFAVAICFDAF